MKFLTAMVALVIACAGCALPSTQRAAKRNATFDPAEYAPFEGTGTGTLKGQAFALQRGGGVVKAAGRPVFLNPGTTYSEEWFRRGIMLGVVLEAADPRALEFTRTTVADADGRFTFRDLPAGAYYVATTVTWEVPASQYSTTIEGGNVGAAVDVRDGETTEAILKR